MKKEAGLNSGKADGKTRNRPVSGQGRSGDPGMEGKSGDIWWPGGGTAVPGNC